MRKLAMTLTLLAMIFPASVLTGQGRGSSNNVAEINPLTGDVFLIIRTIDGKKDFKINLSDSKQVAEASRLVMVSQLDWRPYCYGHWVGYTWISDSQSQVRPAVRLSIEGVGSPSKIYSGGPIRQVEGNFESRSGGVTPSRLRTSDSSAVKPLRRNDEGSPVSSSSRGAIQKKPSSADSVSRDRASSSSTSTRKISVSRIYEYSDEKTGCTALTNNPYLASNRSSSKH